MPKILTRFVQSFFFFFFFKHGVIIKKNKYIYNVMWQTIAQVKINCSSFCLIDSLNLSMINDTEHVNDMCYGGIPELAESIYNISILYVTSV